MEAIFPFPKAKTKLVFLDSQQLIFVRIAKTKKYSLLFDKNLETFIPRELRKNAFALPAGESCKNWDCLGQVLTWLALKKAERSETLFVIGGGAACDLGAMAAALYRRGMPLVLVPTTLLSQLDAAVGGKCAVDFVEGKTSFKNFAGVFYPAQEVWMGSEFLSTLPPRERRSGIGELLKMLYLKGTKPNIPAMQAFLKDGIIAPALQKQIKLAIQAKTEFVKRDPLDTKRIREALNFGHTVGHAIETMAQGNLAHGEAVALGLFFETAFLERKSGLKFAQTIYGDLMRLQFPFPEIAKAAKAKNWESLFLSDKKMSRRKLEMSVVKKPGSITRCEASPKELAHFMAGAFQALVQLGKVHPPG